MEGEPRNAAANLARHWVVLLNDRDRFVEEGLSLVTPDFVRYDERRLTAQPPVVGGQAWVDGVIELEQLAGEWPRYEVTKVLAVRGDRLAATHWVLRFGETAEMEFITVFRSDKACERGEVTYFFDPKARAVSQLDTLHAEIET